MPHVLDHLVQRCCISLVRIVLAVLRCREGAENLPAKILGPLYFVPASLALFALFTVESLWDLPISYTTPLLVCTRVLIWPLVPSFAFDCRTPVASIGSYRLHCHATHSQGTVPRRRSCHLIWNVMRNLYSVPRHRMLLSNAILSTRGCRANECLNVLRRSIVRESSFATFSSF